MFLRSVVSKFKTKNTRLVNKSNNLKKSGIQLGVKRLNFRVLYYYGRKQNNFLFRDNSIVVKSLALRRFSTRPLESFRRVLKRLVTKEVSFTAQVFPFSNLTKRPQEVRMGRGKAARVYDRIAFLKPGSIIYKIVGSIDFTSSIQFLNLFFECNGYEFQLLKRLGFFQFKIPFNFKIFVLRL